MGFTIGDVIGRTFRAFGRNWVALVAANAIAALLAMLPLLGWAAITMPALFAHGPRELSGAVAAGAAGSMLLGMAGSIVLWILFAPALSRMALAAARDERPRVADVFDFRRAGTFLGAGLLAGLCVMAGSLLLVVPGVIVALGLSLVSFCVVDGPDERGAVDALGASWSATRGHRLALFGLVLLGGVAQLVLQAVLGASPWLFPLLLAYFFVQTPLWTLALANVYLRLQPQRAA